MEQERKARENEEKDRADRMRKIKDQFTDPNGQWEKDKADISNMALEDKAKDAVVVDAAAKAQDGEKPVHAEPVAENVAPK
jgi:mannan polymerase II complex ANP1 subunit